MSEKSILFSTPMVQAILEGRKTMTRRVLKSGEVYLWGKEPHLQPYIKRVPQVGDILWVRETWNEYLCDSECVGRHFIYKADFHELPEYSPDCPGGESKFIYKHWKPSIFMPKEAARIWLEVTDVRVERLQNITEEDAKTEGVGIEWIRGWIRDNYKEPEECPYWVDDRFHGYNQAFSFCKRCGEKEVKKMKLLATQEGATEQEIEEIYLAGGWEQQEDDSPTHCEHCWKPLRFTPLDTCIREEFEHFLNYGFCKSDAYLLDQITDDEYSEIESFNKTCFRTLWDSLNEKRGYSWESNPWVWVIEFKRVEHGGSHDRA
jgi:uncharacterized protein YqfB (UPF0267 family)